MRMVRSISKSSSPRYRQRTRRKRTRRKRGTRKRTRRKRMRRKRMRRTSIGNRKRTRRERTRRRSRKRRKRRKKTRRRWLSGSVLRRWSEGLGFEAGSEQDFKLLLGSSLRILPLVKASEKGGGEV